ncbi:MAG: YgiQ family radical SAM protein [Smithellaceae bacterium]|nr:YgiQ family radical SAM protein [Smithellaceae bacterium]
MFLPTTKDECLSLGWRELDVVLVTGDTYIDSPYFGVALIGKVLVSAGFRVGVIAQPDWSDLGDIRRLGEPLLFWGVTGGSVDSMVANYTALKKRRTDDDFTPGGVNNRRPDRAVLVYAALIRQAFRKTRPIILGGIEASLRRIPHYDYWQDRVRGSILVDSGADFLLYGMAEKAVRELAERLAEGREIRQIRGLCHLADEANPDFLSLPSLSEVMKDKGTFGEMFNLFAANQDHETARGLCQKQDHRWLIHNPPQPPLTTDELGYVYGLDYEQEVHPYYQAHGPVKALATVRDSLTTHRGCVGGCSFCSIAIHQGRRVVSRSEDSLLREALRLTKREGFKGNIQDVGGPTANMYGLECVKEKRAEPCRNRQCLFPKVCPNLLVDHGKQLRLLNKLRQLPGIKRVFVASGIRYDLVLADRKMGRPYLEAIVSRHVSGQLKVAPEHIAPAVLSLMKKPPWGALLKFKQLFQDATRRMKKDQYLTYYLMAAHPGCREEDMRELARFVQADLQLHPRQVQIFTPTPSTASTLMYHLGCDPQTGKTVFVERDLRKKERQKKILFPSRRGNEKRGT